MAHRDLALHAQRLGALQDQLERERAHGAGLVQMDVERALVPVGNAEEHIERAHRVAVDRAGVEAAEHIRALRKRLAQQFGRARPAQQARLRKRDDLDLQHLRERLPRAQRAFEMAQARLCVHIDMRAQPRGAAREKGLGQHQRLRGRVMPARMPEGALVLDLVDEVGADLVAVPVHAPQRLVEVGVAFDQARQQQGASALLDRCIGGRGQRGAGFRDAAIAHQHIGGGSAHGAHIADQERGHGKSVDR